MTAIISIQRLDASKKIAELELLRCPGKEIGSKARIVTSGFQHNIEDNNSFRSVNKIFSVGWSFPWDIACGQWDSEGQRTPVSVSILHIVGINCCILLKAFYADDIKGDIGAFISQGAFEPILECLRASQFKKKNFY